MAHLSITNRLFTMKGVVFGVIDQPVYDIGLCGEIK